MFTDYINELMMKGYKVSFEHSVNADATKITLDRNNKRCYQDIPNDDFLRFSLLGDLALSQIIDHMINTYDIWEKEKKW